MRTLQAVPLTVGLLFPMSSRGQQSCPWLNSATASGVLKGPVIQTVLQKKAEMPNMRPANAISSAGPSSANASSSSYSDKSIDDSDCTFVRQAGSVAAKLRIEVRTMSEPGKEFGSFIRRCGNQAMPLKAIGSQAAVCTLNSKAGHLLEQVVGRVRDRAFTIRLSTDDSSMTQSSLREKAQKVAEQVAGNLF